MMNRQLRRAEEKKEKRAEREKAKAKAERQARRRERAAERERAASARSAAKEGDAKAGGGGTKADRPRTSNPGRFSGALMTATVFFIALQAVGPSDGTIPSQLVSASFYLLFAYFAVLWMMRRDSPRPIAVAVGAAVAMGIVTGVSQWLQPNLDPQPLMLALTLPLAVAGAFLGRLVWRRAP